MSSLSSKSSSKNSSRATSPIPAQKEAILPSPKTQARQRFRGPGRVPDSRVTTNGNEGQPVLVGGGGSDALTRGIQRVKLEIDVGEDGSVTGVSLDGSGENEDGQQLDVGRKLGPKTIERTSNSDQLLGEGGKSILSTVSDWDAKVKVVKLYGGAMTCIVPEGWRDVSGVRQVPDHQEVWQDVSERLSVEDRAAAGVPGDWWVEEMGREGMMVVEILERQDEVKDRDCVRFFWDDLCESNGCTENGDNEVSYDRWEGVGIGGGGVVRGVKVRIGKDRGYQRYCSGKLLAHTARLILPPTRRERSGRGGAG